MYVSLDVVSFSVFSLLLFGELYTAWREQLGAAVFPERIMILVILASH